MNIALWLQRAGLAQPERPAVGQGTRVLRSYGEFAGRAARLAGALRDTCGLAGLAAPAEVDDDLAEWDYGDYEGRTTAQIREHDPNWTIFTGDPPGGETAEQVSARADRVLARAVAADGPVALFSHGHFLRVLGARWIGLGARDGRLLGLDTATLSILGHEREQQVLRVWNSGA